MVTLPGVEIPGHVASGLGNEHHPMRIMTRRAAGLAPGGWDRSAVGLVGDTFDALAPEWHTRTSPQRTEVVADALSRGLFEVGGERDLAVEVGAGIGTYSGLVTQSFRTVLSLDLSREMITRAPVGPAHRIVADASMLPIGDDCADGVVLINAFVFPGEVRRVLKPGGAIVWVNSSGSQTPIHLSTNDLVEALPFPVHGSESTAGVGTWCVLIRDNVV